MKYYCMSCRTEIPEGDQLCPRCQGELARQEFKTLKGQALAGDIKGAKMGLIGLGGGRYARDKV